MEMVFQSIKFEEKFFFSQNTLRERAAITVALKLWPSGRAALFL
jgi:hypothetical protein